MPRSPARLARGLQTLIGPSQRPTAPRATPNGASPDRVLNAAEIVQIPIDQVRPNPNQPRRALDEAALEGLAGSIRSSGLLQPILVRRTGEGNYELVAGERRLRAAKLAGLNRVPAVVRELSDADAFQAALIENLQREDLSPLERAAAYQHFIDNFHSTVEALAERLGESRANISNYLRLLRLPAEILGMLDAGQLGMGQARAIVGVSNPQRQLAIARLAVRRNLSVRQVEALAREAEQQHREPAKSSARPVRDAHIPELEQALSKAIGLPVALKPGRRKNSGKIIIRYNSLEEFDLIAERFGVSRSLE